MALASLLDLGADFALVKKALSSMYFEEGKIELIFEERLTHGIRGKYFNTLEDHVKAESDHDHDHDHTHAHDHDHDHAHAHDHAHDHDHGHDHDHDHTHAHPHDHTHDHDHGHAPHRGFTAIKSMIQSADMTENAKKIAENCFKVLGESEARIHGKGLEDVHFHEVGARDSIADIVGVAVCFDNLGVSEVRVSTISVGSGMVKCAHGNIPVPAPATSLLLAGYPIRSESDVPYELTTPTGAAILKGMNAVAGMPDNFVFNEVGHGLGSKEIGRPNFLRAFLSTGTKDTKKKILIDSVVELQTNIDNATGELVGHVAELLMNCGALDVTISHVMMKKGRPGIVLTVLACHQKAEELEEMIFNELPTIGLRKRIVERRILKREATEMEVCSESVNAKKVFEVDGTEDLRPEFAELVRLSHKTNVPVRKLK